jgi:hypothetical protein
MLVAADHSGPAHGAALRAVAGQRVRVLDVPGDIDEVELALFAGVGLQIMR